MQNWRESYDKVFEEIKNLLSELSKSHTYEDILMKENEINQLYQKFSFLKVSQNFEFSSTEIEPLQIIENQLTNSDSNLISVEDFEEENKVAEIVVEETEIHDIFDDVPEVEEVHSFEEIDAREDLLEEQVLENDPVNEIDEVQNEEQIDEVNGFYFMGNHSMFNGGPILTLQINNGKNKSIKLKKKNVSTVLHYLHDNNIPFLNLNSNIPPSINIGNKSYRNLFNELFFILASCMMFILGVSLLFTRNENISFMRWIYQYLFGIACILVGLTLLCHPAVKINDNELVLKGYFHKSII